MASVRWQYISLSCHTILMACSGRQLCMQALRREADGKALVLLDEVGTGTDPAEGAALGVALLRALAAGGARGAAFTMATTHHRFCCAISLLASAVDSALYSSPLGNPSWAADIGHAFQTAVTHSVFPLMLLSLT